MKATPPVQATIPFVWETRVDPLPDGSFRVSAVAPRPQTNEGKDLTVAEVAERLRMSKRLVTRLCGTGEIAAYRQREKIWLIPPAALRIYRMWRRGEITTMQRSAAMAEIRERVG